MLANDPFAGDLYSAHPAAFGAAPELVSENGQVAPPPAPTATQTVYSPGANFGAYTSAAQNEAAATNKAGLPPGAVQQYLHNARVSYARQQLAKYRRAAPQIQGFSSQLKNYDGADPIAAYKALSAAMAAMAQQHGYADPRVFLHNALNGGSF